MPFTWVFKLSHPASASYNGTEWSSEGVFHSLNKILKDRNNQTINWLDVPEQIEDTDIPF
jgi:uracil DNA glycosylase